MRWRVPLRRLLLPVLTLSYPVVVYVGLQHWSPRAMALVLAALTLLRFGAARMTAWRILAPAAVALAALAAWADHALPLKLYPALVNAALLAVFGWSLWHPPTVVERLARLREPDLPPHAVRYTRRVTQVWCVFFIFNGLVAAWTAWFATERVWALYNGGIAYVLIGLLFAGEWLVRRRVIARHRPVARPLMPAVAWTSREALQARATLRIDAGLAVFDGHFPQAPIVPGVAQTHWAIALAEQVLPVPARERFARLDALKFQQVIRPGDVVELALDWQPERLTLGFRLSSAAGPHASGRVVYRGADV